MNQIKDILCIFSKGRMIHFKVNQQTMELHILYGNKGGEMFDKRGSSIGEIFLILSIFLLLVYPFLMFELWWWFSFMSGITIIFILFELGCKLATGKTLSQQFWKWSNEEKNKNMAWKVWLVLTGMLGAWIILLIHLAWKIIR